MRFATAMIWVCLLATQAHAGGFFTPPHGARPLGRAGASVAGGDDLNALWYNPALLTSIKEAQFMADLTLFHQQVEFDRAARLHPDGRLEAFDTIRNEAAPLPIPQLGIAGHLGTSRLTFALGLFAPNASAAAYPQDGPQRYTLVDTRGSLKVTQEAALAWRITENLSLGFGLQNTTVALNLVTTASGNPGIIGDPEDEAFDILIQARLNEPFNLSANAGLHLEMGAGLSAGASVQLPTRVRGDARFEHRMASHVLFDQAVLTGNKLSVALDFPAVFRAGLRLTRPSWDVELALGVERWSKARDIEMTPKGVQVEGIPGLGSLKMNALNLPRHYQDAWSLRLGGRTRVSRSLDLRAGVLGETSALPKETLSVLQVDMFKVALGLGITVRLEGGVALDLGYAHVFYAETEVSDTAIRQLNPTEPEGGPPVAAGRYRASADLLGLGMRYDF